MRQRWLLSSPLARAVLVILVLLTGFHLVLLHLCVTPDTNVEAAIPLVAQRSPSGGVRDEVTLDFARPRSCFLPLCTHSTSAHFFTRPRNLKSPHWFL